MKPCFAIIAGLILLNTSCTMPTKKNTNSGDEVKLITLAPGHFHAALVQKTSYPQVSKDVYVYAPEGDELQEHLKKIEEYNTRTDSPTQWNEMVYTGEDYMEKMLSEKKGNVLITAGNNERKTEYIRQAVSGGIHVLADKPMAIHTDDFEKLKESFRIAEQNGVLLYDIMTERFEIATILQKEFSLLPTVYGEQQTGTADEPAVVKESVHHFLKTVSGSPLKRPAWFFDVAQQGAGLVDVTTHLVDLVQWELFPEQPIDYRKDIKLLDAHSRSTALTPEQFKDVTGLDAYPAFLQKDVSADTLHVYANGDISYKIKDVHAKVSVLWNYSYPEGGGDTHYSIMKGSKAHLIIKQGKEQGYKPALYIKAAEGIDKLSYEKDLQESISVIARKYPGVTLHKIEEDTWEVHIPETYRNGHEAHFEQVMENFLQYLKNGLPEWEVPCMIAKYYTTTYALKMAQEKNK
ncbi:MAG: Gfo/Idh/MocA family oxidoreductase [Tannerellaceae bacterium]|jgi:predicted dehydrogenase|nr:Gfo/Idh/MocA family oxidoreductase [Tannerellaceae bacterium]